MDSIPVFKTIPFVGVCSPRSTLVLSTPLITVPFSTVELSCSFPANTRKKFQIHFFLSEDNSTPSTGEPLGINILKETGHTDHLIGENEFKQFKHVFHQIERNSYLKVYANNTDWLYHEVDATITILLKQQRGNQ